MEVCNRKATFQLCTAGLKYSFQHGDPAGTRTPDLRLKRALLYQLSYWVVWPPTGSPAKPPSRLCGERSGSRPNESPKPGPPGRRPSGGLGRGGTAERASFRRRRKRVSVARADVAGMAGLEPANAGVKVPCLTTWLHPNLESETRAGADAPALSHSMGWVMGLEPTTPGTTIRCSAS